MNSISSRGTTAKVVLRSLVTSTGSRLGAIIVVLALLTAGGCGTTPTSRVHHSLLEKERPAPMRLVVLPIQLTMTKLSFMMEHQPVDERHEQAVANIGQALTNYSPPDRGLRIEPLPALTDEQMGMLNAYIARCQGTAAAAFDATYGKDVAKDRLARFDFTVGEGLPFLKQLTGADAVLLVSGHQVRASGASRASAGLFLMTFMWLLYPPMLTGAVHDGFAGSSALAMYVVHLETGDILWLKHSKKDWNLWKPNRAKAMVRKMLADYPGVEPYRAQPKTAFHKSTALD